MTETPTTLPAPEPNVDPGAAPFWSAAAKGELVAPRCRACEFLVWYPRPFCPACGSTDVAWEQLSGRGTVYSFSIVRRGSGAFEAASPYVLAYVELDEGPRVMTNIVDVDAERVEIGQAVEAVFHPTEGGTALLRFRSV